MRIVKVKGGLGNQLFQYSFAKALEAITKDEIKLDMSTYDSLLDDAVRRPRLLKFNISLQLATPEEIQELCILKHSGSMIRNRYRIGIAAEAILNRKYFFERNRAYIAPSSIQDYRYFDGYWQSWKTVNGVWDAIKEELVPNYTLNKKTIDFIDSVSEENSVFVGIRKGDYQGKETHYGVFGQEYYATAMDYISERVRNPHFHIFSNDIKWAKENLDFSKYWVSYREQEDVVDDFEDLMIMANCKHAIVVNSTYHWWGARLHNADQKIVIAPKRWFQDNKPIDIVPAGWIRI